jgi:adenylosuccinate synthase
MHEVSQGFALSVNHGTHYPECTFRDCTAQQAYSDFCITPDLVGDVYLNVRSYTIRVGNNFRDGQQVGYSGDFCSDQVETTWEQIAKDAEMPDDEARSLAERERTTVTKKIRRVATQSWSLLADSAMACGATKLILNFPQNIHWSSYKARGGPAEFKQLHPKVREYVSKMEETTNLPVVMIGTSAEHNDYIWLG